MRAFTCFLLCFLVGAVPSAAQTDAPQLDAASRLERQLTGAAVHSYGVLLRAGYFFEVEVDQHGIDVAVILYDPAGAVLLAVDSPNGPDGPEELAAIATVAGDYRFEVRAPGGGSGTYQLTVRALRPASESDRNLADAMRIYARSEELRKRPDADSRRQALDGYRRTLELLSAVDAPRLRARALRRSGQLLGDSADVGEKLASLQQAEPLVRTHGNGWELLPLLNDLGLAYQRAGEPDKARAVFEEAVEIGERLGHHTGKAIALNNLGLLSHSMGELQTALTYYDRSMAQRRRLDRRAGEATVLHNIGLIYTSLGRREESLDFLHQALAAHEAGGDPQGRGRTLLAIGRLRFLDGEIDKAIAEYRRALEDLRAVGDRRGEATALELLGTAYIALERYPEAQMALANALRMARSVGDPVDEAHVLMTTGLLDRAVGDPADSLQRHRQSLEMFRALGLAHGEAWAELETARTEHQRGRLKEAQTLFEDSLKSVDSRRARLQSTALRGSFLATKYDDYGAYVDLLMKLDAEQPGKGHAERAFEVSERTRARSLLDDLASRTGSSGRVPEELSERLRNLARIVSAKETRRLELLRSGSGNREAAVLDREVRLLLLDYEKLEGESRAATAGTSSAEPLRLEEIRDEVLDDESLLLAYRLGETRSFLWVVARESFAGYVLPPRPELESLARQVHDLLPRSHELGLRTQVQLTTETLSDHILGPAVDELGDRRLLIVADGALEIVPFAALPVVPRFPQDSPIRQRVPLLAEHEIVRLPSASVLAALRRAPRRHADRVLAMVADPVFQADDPRLGSRAQQEESKSGRVPSAARSAIRDFGFDRFERLPFSGQEARAVLSLVPVAGRFEAIGTRANREVVLGGELGHYRIVHFATHGLLNARHPELSGIALSMVDGSGGKREGLLWAHEIAELDLAADLVVLSACRTALGREIRGEGIVGLANAFFQAGAATVVVSSWNVDDRATAELMVRFYRGLLREGRTPAQALRTAQLSMLENQTYSAPYYWAGFSLQGEWR